MINKAIFSSIEYFSDNFRIILLARKNFHVEKL